MPASTSLYADGNEDAVFYWFLSPFGEPNDYRSIWSLYDRTYAKDRGVAIPYEETLRITREAIGNRIPTLQQFSHILQILYRSRISKRAGCSSF